MKGDFSTWQFKSRDNIVGVLHQQGRVMRDADLTESDLIALAWQDQAGRDIIGAGVAAVPAMEPDGFKITAANVSVTPAAVHVKAKPGRIWADGQLIYLERDPGVAATADNDRIATYLPPPFNSAAPTNPTPANITDGVRDVVILEVSREELNGFQPARNVTAPDGTSIELIDRLLEPALGGPDTAERILTRTAFRLVRIGATEDCTSIIPRLKDNPSSLGRLTAALRPATTVPGDCPVVKSGGYTGFEHNLYRIEIADTTDGVARFKWSQFNGGLVGRGTFNSVLNEFTLTANFAAIINAGINDFYLETVIYDAALGHWRIGCGVPVQLTADQKLRATAAPVFGGFAGLSASATTFFRLWNGLRAVADFTNIATPVELRDGIRLTFDAPNAASFPTNYRPGDFWTFTVRAGEVLNPQTLINARPPFGPAYSRVPLAEINWTARRDTTISGSIEDCRKRFRPLTNQKVCCTLLVGNGITSFGDFNSLEEAAAHLPMAGGELCLLPGVHFANLVLENRTNITIHGCEKRTMVLPRLANVGSPIFHVKGGSEIEIAEMDLISFGGTPIWLQGVANNPIRGACLHDLRMIACVEGVRAEHVVELHIARNLVYLLDTEKGLAALSILADDAVIERNTLVVWPIDLTPPDDGSGNNGNNPGNPADPCADPADFYANIGITVGYVGYIWGYTLTALLIPAAPYKAIGGIHLRGGCERVKLLQNMIHGGAGNGVTLGGLLSAADTEPATSTGPVTAVAAPQVSIEAGQIIVLVQDTSGAPLDQIDVFLDNGAAWTDTTDATGRAQGKVANDTYELSVSPGWKIEKLELTTLADGSIVHEITLSALTGSANNTLSSAFAFLHEIKLQENDITRMGLSGVGFGLHPSTTPPVTTPALPTTVKDYLIFMFDVILFALTPRDLVRTSNVVRDLVIRGNRIQECLLTPFDTTMRTQAAKIGRGGISLGMVDACVISENHLFRNGPRGTDPICGIFVGHGNDLEITDNTLADNGAAPADYESAKLEGLRGGIVVRFAGALANEFSRSTGRKPALRVHDNRVDQPTGRALTANAFGPVSIANNHFNAELTGRFQLWDQLTGGVLLFNFGGLHRLFMRLYGDLFTKYNYDLTTGKLVDPKDAKRSLPGGETLFADNQLRVGQDNRSFTSALLLALDDLGYGGNQTSIFQPDLLLANTILVGGTVRATSSRFIEDVDHTLSLMTFGIMANLTAHNQADHCIIANPPRVAADPLPTTDQPNQVLDASFCSRFSPTRDDGSIDEASREKALGEYFSSFLVAFAQQQGIGSANTNLEFAEFASVANGKTVEAAAVLGESQGLQQKMYTQEAARMEAKYGENHSYVRVLDEQAEARRAAVKQLNIQTEAAQIKVAPAPAAAEAVVDGRVVDPASQRGQSGVTVELVRGERESIAKAETDAQGYYSFKLDEKQAAALSQEKQLHTRVLDAKGKELARAEKSIAVKPGTIARNNIPLAIKPVSFTKTTGPKVTVFTAAKAPTDHSAPAPVIPRPPVATPPVRAAAPVTAVKTPTTPDDNPKPVKGGTPLENVKGIGPKTAAKLRAAGIPDLETLIATDSKKLVDLFGFDAAVIKRDATKAVAKPTPGKPAEAKVEPATHAEAKTEPDQPAPKKPIASAKPAPAKKTKPAPRKRPKK